jgi:hypothetical protein
MVSSYTSNKSIEKPAYNDYAGNPTGWSGPINDDWDAIDAAFGGRLALNATGSVGTVNLTITQTRNLIITITGVMTGNAVYTLPQNTAATAVVGGQWIVYNNTTGSFTVTISPVSGGGTSVVCQQGYVTSIYCDGTNISRTSTVPIANNSVTNAMLATVATQIIKGRATAGTGNVEDLTITQILDFLSSTQGAVLYRGASAWAGLAPGTSGQYLTTNGAAANPSWTTAPSVLPSQTGKSKQSLTTDGTNPSWTPLAVTAQAGLVTTGASSPTVTFSRSITSVTRASTGTWNVALSGFADANYTVHVTGGTGLSVLCNPSISSKTSSGFTIDWYFTNAVGKTDPNTGINVDITVFGGV